MMPPRDPLSPSHPWLPRCGKLVVSGLVFCGIWLTAGCRSEAAEPYRETFEGRFPSWQTVTVPSDIEVTKHDRDPEAGRNGGCERVRYASSRESSPLRLEHALPAAKVLDELTATAWVQSDHPGWVLALRIIAPGVMDPQTGRPAELILTGDVYRDPGKWQPLRCRTSDKEIRQRLVLLRARFPGVADVGELIVDRAILACPVPLGRAELRIDDLEFAPIVSPRETVAPAPVARPVVAEPPVSFQLDRLQVDGRPFLPRMVRYHGESPEWLRRAGFNVVWIPDWTDADLIRRLRQQDLWATAEPPRPRDESGDPLKAQKAGLVPFGNDADGILFWMLGTRLTGEDRPRLTDWIEQIEFADRRRTRPIAADVAEDEWSYSRDLKLLGISRHIVQTTLSFSDYRDWMIERRSRARPGAFVWTWIQTEPVSSVRTALPQADEPPFLEPEQLRLQVYAALAAGCRGIGYWTTERLDSQGPRAEERFLAIQQLNQELSLLEPWLATSGSVQLVPGQLPDAAPTPPASRNLPFGTSLPNVFERGAQLRAREAELRRQHQRERELQAAILRTELGTLILPMWLEGQSQFVPAQSAAAGVTWIVPGTEQSAAVCEISTTHLHSLEAERVAGGVQIRLPRLDLTGMVWMTSDLAQVEKVRQRIASGQADAGATAVALARLKLDRVGLIDQELQHLGPGVPDGPQLLGRAKLRLDRAQGSQSTGDGHAARSDATETLQLLRILQRAHWDDAVRPLSTPVGSPDTLCFQTLPQHWRLMADLGRSRQRDAINLLRSGEFEDFDTLIAERWQNVHSAPPQLRTSAEVFPTGRSSRHSLRLVCEPAAGVTALPPLSEPMITVMTPGVPVRTNQILHISGWVKVVRAVSGSLDGFLVYDSLLGRSGGVRFRSEGDWQRFELVRRVPASTDLHLTLSLYGPGDVLIDDLQVVPHDLRSGSGDDSSEPVLEQTSGARLMDRLPKIPRFVPLPRRDADSQDRE